MALPLIPLGTTEVMVGDTGVTIRSLSRAEVVTLGNMRDGDPNDAETFMLSKACGITETEAREWLNANSAATADGLLVSIAVLSGIQRPGNA